MPHLSKEKLAEKTLTELNKQVVGFLSDTTPKKRSLLFKELLTKTERTMIAKRLAMVYLIQKKTPTHSISRILKVSPSTVARFELYVESSGLPNTCSFVSEMNESKLQKFFKGLAGVAFEASNKSLKEILDNNF